MRLWPLALLLTSTAFASVGKITKIVGTNDAYVVRPAGRVALTPELELNEGDILHTESSHVVLLIDPGTQLSVPKKSELQLTKAKIVTEGKLVKGTSSVDLLKGQVRALVTRDPEVTIDQSITSGNVAFGVRGTEFEVTLDGDDVDLDVVEGEVIVSSPDVHTFVPEIVKKGEGFRFARKKKQFMRRAFKLRMKDHPGFIKRKMPRDLRRVKRRNKK